MSKKRFVYLMVAALVVVSAFASMAFMTKSPARSNLMPEVVIVARAPAAEMDTVVVVASPDAQPAANQ